MVSHDTSFIIMDTSTIAHQVDSLVQLPPVPSNESPQKGIAMVYCPAKMIRNIPSIISATISRDELSKAVENFKQKVQDQNKDVKKEIISRDIKADSIDIYDKMGVDIEFDSDDFVEILKSKHNAVKEFGDKQTLDWEWTIKPLHSTEKSIIKFEFYYVDPDNKANYVLEKTISVVATVDARSYLDKWKDFLFEDSKTTVTAILIPFITFIGGFFSGKKKK
jgi:hypothetical protein